MKPEDLDAIRERLQKADAEPLLPGENIWRDAYRRDVRRLLQELVVGQGASP